MDGYRGHRRWLRAGTGQPRRQRHQSQHAARHAERDLHGVGRRAQTRQRRNARAGGTRHEQRTQGVRSRKRIGWQAKAPAPQKRTVWRTNVGQTLSSVNPAISAMLLQLLTGRPRGLPLWRPGGLPHCPLFSDNSILEASKFGTRIALLLRANALQPPSSTTWPSNRWQHAARHKRSRRQHAAWGIPPMKTIFFLLLSASATFAQVVPGRYILELSGDPAAVAAVQQGARPGARATALAAHRTAVRQSQASARTAVAARGGTVVESLDTVFNGLIVNIPDARAAELLEIPGAVKLHAVRRVQPLLNHALPLHKVPDAWNLLPLGQDGAGAGIKIAMIDSGVDVNNPAFSDPLPPVDGFPKVLFASDTRFTNAKVIVAKNYTTLLPDGGEPDADDRDGHGTGTSVAAAGGAASTPYGPLTGVAPKAYIGNYKVLDANGGTSDVIAKAIDDAVADGMDVINISLGSYVTSYSDIASSEVGQAAIARAAQAGVIVVVAAGNSGPGAGTIGDYASAPDAITMGAIHNDRSLGNAITIDGVAPYAAFTGDGPDPGQVIGGTLFDVTKVDSSSLACSPLPSGSVAGKIVLVLRGTCTFTSKLNDVAAGGALAVIVYNNPGGATFTTGYAGVGTATLPALFVNQSEGADLKARAAGDSGVQVALDFVGVTAFAARTDVSDFSSRGPSVGSALKPDLVAVGDEIVTGAQNSYTSGQSNSASGFIDTAGTSFSTPLVAGAAAVLKAARPGLTVQQYRSLLINGAAAATASEGVTATLSQAGAGILNLAAAVGGRGHSTRLCCERKSC